LKEWGKKNWYYNIKPENLGQGFALYQSYNATIKVEVL
jgi:hypothetical protein